MKQLFIAFLIVLGLSACTNPEEAIKAMPVTCKEAFSTVCDTDSSSLYSLP